MFYKEPHSCMQTKKYGTDAFKKTWVLILTPTSAFVGQTSDAATGVATIIVNDAGKHVGHCLAWNLSELHELSPSHKTSRTSVF